jgi:tRNA pseudouridine55 synthase
MDRYNGILPVHKEAGPTSHDVVNRVRRLTGAEKVGHTGTLDPMATGLLLLCLGQATKLSRFISDWDKRYLAEVTLGQRSDTMDGDGRLEASGPVPDLTEADVKNVLSRFTGRITQTVPAYSAVKLDGRRMYDYARKGKAVTAPEREIEIKSLELKSFEPPRMALEALCSKGTYIRSLADDIGRELGCGGYLSALMRLAVGPFEAVAALSVDEIAKRHEADELAGAILPVEQVLDFPVVRTRTQARELIRHGAVMGGDDILGWHGSFAAGDLISVADERGIILAIGRARCDADCARAQGTGDFFSYVRVLI